MPGTRWAAIKTATPLSTTWSRARIMTGSSSTPAILSRPPRRRATAGPSRSEGERAGDPEGGGGPARLYHHLALVVEAQAGDPLLPVEPLGARHLARVEVRVAATLVAQEVVVDLLVHAAVALLVVPVLDRRQGGQHARRHAGLLGHLADGGLLGGLTGLDVPLGELPAPAGLGRDEEDLGVAHHQAPRRAVVLDDAALGRRCPSPVRPARPGGRTHGRGAQFVGSSSPEVGRKAGRASGSTPTLRSASAQTEWGSRAKMRSVRTGAVS